MSKGGNIQNGIQFRHFLEFIAEMREDDFTECFGALSGPELHLYIRENGIIAFIGCLNVYRLEQLYEYVKGKVGTEV